MLRLGPPPAGPGFPSRRETTGLASAGRGERFFLLSHGPHFFYLSIGPRRRQAGTGTRISRLARHNPSGAFVRYHSIVRLSPASKSVVARKPNSCSALLTSRHRRGCPSGLLGSQLILPAKRVSRAIRLTTSRIAISRPAPRFTGSGLSYRTVASTIARAIFDVQELATRRARTPHLDLLRSGFHRVDAFLDERRDDGDYSILRSTDLRSFCARRKLNKYLVWNESHASTRK